MTQVKYPKKLIAGLEWFIKKVEAMDPETEFAMEYFNRCVIGKSLGVHFSWDERTVLRNKFDIRRTTHEAYFCEEGSKFFKPHHWEVIRLFTTSVGEKLTAQEWLILAKAQLSKMNGA